MTKGKIFGVGLGPGAQDLMSVRSDRLIRGATHVAYFRKRGRKGHARTIVEGMLPENVTEFAMEYPVTTEIHFQDQDYVTLLADFYQECTQSLLALTEQGHDVVVICEGDPFFYGSFMHLYTRLIETVDVEVVPAITGMSAAWTATHSPITWGDDVLTVLMGTLPEEKLAEHVASTDALVIMKVGRNIGKIRKVLDEAGKTDRAYVVKYAAMEQQEVLPLSQVDRDMPYFSIVLIHGQGRRP